MDCRDPNLRFDRPCLRAAVAWLRVRLILAGVWLSCCQAQEITRAEDLLKLSQEEAASARPVRLVGTVIGGSEIGRNRAVVHDGKSCAYIRNDALPDLVWENGAQVEVVGVSDPGGFAPIIVASSVRTLGHGPLPAPIRAVYEELLWGGLNGQWIEMRGVVRSCRWYPDLSPPGSVMMLATGGQQISVRVSGKELTADRWVDSSVRIRGICFHRYNDQRQALGPRLWVPENEPVIQEETPPENPFEGTPRSIRSLLQHSGKGAYGHRMLIEGEVIHSEAGSRIFVRDGSQCIQVNTSQDVRLGPGDRIRVLGFPYKSEHSPSLDDAICKITARAVKLPEPLDLSRIADAYSHDPELVRLTATVIGRVLHRDGWAISVTSEGVQFPLVLPASSGAPSALSLKPGARIEVSGICLDSGYWMPDGVTVFSSSFRILLRSPADIRVIAEPPWWTPGRLNILLGSLVAASLGAIALVTLVSRVRLRRQVADRRQAEGEFAAILSERNRMAREIHDTEAQDLSAIAAQLEVARSKLGPGNDGALLHITMAREAACSSLQEARRSIWNMRSQVLEDWDLAEALIRLLEQATRGTATRGVGRVSGDMRRLPSAQENNLLRIGQEAIHNAMLHGHPGMIELTMDFSDIRVRLCIKDDGCGFDPVAADKEPSIHFGLAGMRERIQQCGGILNISSKPGIGTEISCEMAVETCGLMSS